MRGKIPNPATDYYRVLSVRKPGASSHGRQLRMMCFDNTRTQRNETSFATARSKSFCTGSKFTAQIAQFVWCTTGTQPASEPMTGSFGQPLNQPYPCSSIESCRLPAVLASVCMMPEPTPNPEQDRMPHTPWTHVQSFHTTVQASALGTEPRSAQHSTLELRDALLAHLRHAAVQKSCTSSAGRTNSKQLYLRYEKHSHDAAAS